LNIIPFKIVPLRSGTPLPLLEALFEECLWYHLHVIHCISDDVLNCLKSSSFKGNFEFGELKKKSRTGRGQVNRGVVEWYESNVL
jgi:hypothetical protein